MITIQSIIALIILFLYFSIERFYRIGKDAKTLVKTKYDKGSTNLTGFAYLTSWLIILTSTVLCYFNKVCFYNKWISWIGVIISVSGFSIRLFALFSLGKFYTRTIRITDNHKIITTGTYRYIRHPGYLGVILMFSGAAMAVSNWVGILYTLLIMPSSFIYRIYAEERMLIDHFGENYRKYMAESWRLLPFIY
jgi:protein-S-isoprenylcysteine O-methyltransferase Ste14